MSFFMSFRAPSCLRLAKALTVSQPVKACNPITLSHNAVSYQWNHTSYNKFKNIQEHFWGENTIFQEHFRRVIRTFYLQLLTLSTIDRVQFCVHDSLLIDELFIFLHPKNPHRLMSPSCVPNLVAVRRSCRKKGVQTDNEGKLTRYYQQSQVLSILLNNGY